MFVALAVMHGRQRVDRQIGGKLFERVAEEEIVNKSVSGQGEMMAVLLDGGGGKNEQSGFARKGVDLLPVEIGEVAGIGNPRLHRLGAPAAWPSVWSSGWKVTIFPGFMRPLGS